MNDQKPILKVGIISDTQCAPSRQDWGTHNMILALHQLARKDIDVLLFPGDMTDCGDLRVYPLYRAILKEAFAGKKLPVQVFNAGNHDFWVQERHPKEDFRRMYELLEQEPVNPYCQTVAGYDFIALSSDDGQNYSDATIQALDDAIAAAVKRDPAKPVFVLTHENPKGTVSGSRSDGSAKACFTKVMSKYPQVVSFSGHTHYPIDDERSIWQGAFTAISTSTLSYGCIEEKALNAIGSILPFAREVVQMMYMEIYEDRLEIHRYHVLDDREIKPDHIWKVALPYKPEEAIYTDEKRRAMRKAPVFDPDAEALLRYDYGYLYLIFPEAKHEDFVQFYRVEAFDLDEDGKKAGEYLYVSNFYRRERNRDPQQNFRLPDNCLKQGHVIRFDIYPVESFGLEGKPLQMTIQIPPTVHYQNTPFWYPQE